MRIDVRYDDETYDPERIVFTSTPRVIDFGNTVDDDAVVTFTLDGATAVLSKSDCDGEFLKEAYAHVRELPFVKAVETL